MSGRARPEPYVGSLITQNYRGTGPIARTGSLHTDIYRRKPNFLRTDAGEGASIPVWGTFGKQAFVIVVARVTVLVAPPRRGVVPGLVRKDLRFVV